MSKEAEEKSFEKAIEELEKIVTKMEAGKLPLNEMMEYFEKGKYFTDFCWKKLSEYEKKIEVLINKNTDNQEEAWKEYNSDSLF